MTNKIMHTRVSKVPEVSSKKEVVTPGVAEQMLGYNTHNRNVRPHQVISFAKDMANGKWEPEASIVRLSPPDQNGRITLLDGQHTLMAIVKAGIPVTLWVMRNVPPSTQNVIDTGARRSFADVLKLSGETNPTILAAAIRSIYVWGLGMRSFGGSTVTQVCTNQTLLDFWEANRWIRQDVSLMAKLAKPPLRLPTVVSASLIYAFRVIVADEDIDDDDNTACMPDDVFFWDRLLDGQDLLEGDPLYTLRKKLTAEHDFKGKKNATRLAALIIKTWNKMRAGQQMFVVEYKPGGSRKEQFPEPR